MKKRYKDIYSIDSQDIYFIDSQSEKYKCFSVETWSSFFDLSLF